jgi:uncharacterized protein YgiM (DUF1202 family)
MKKLIFALLSLVLTSLACTMVFDQPATIATVTATETSIVPKTLPTPPTPPTTGIVTADVLEVRFGPGEQYPNVNLWLKKGTMVIINYCRDDGWCRIQEGFIEQEHVEIK